MRKKIIAGNWKCYKTVDEAKTLINEILNGIESNLDRNVVLCPPFPYLQLAKELVKGSAVMIGAQNLWREDWGAYTGEVSAPMLASLGVEFVIIGHSERREYFKEDGALLNAKVKRALSWNLRPIFCLGEKLNQREEGITFRVVEAQLKEGLEGLGPEELLKIVIAYEPVWAIGTGKNATPEQAQEVQHFLRQKIGEIWGEELAEKIPILYGGSVKPENIDSLMAMPDLDGALVGGASLKSQDFLRIVHFQEKK
jgi:triosephosphate isomerase